MDRLKVAVIGIGNMGSAHANCIAKGEIAGLTLAAVCDIDTVKTARFQKAFPAVKVYSDYRALIRSGEMDAVIIAVPHLLHAEIAETALLQGLHVLVEKPVDVTVTRAKALNLVAQKSGKVFAIMFNQRTNPLFARAKQIVASGELGELKRTVWIVTNWYRTQSYYNSGDWRATWSGEGGGVLLNQAPHNLDLWQWICGMPKCVTAFCDVAKYHRIEVEDDATLFTRYENGAVGTFITSTGEYPGTNRLEISGTLGKIVLEDGMLKWWRLKKPEPEVRQESPLGFAAIDYDYSEFEQEGREPAHKGILQNFANAVLKDEPLISPGIEGINELSLSNAAYLSSFHGNSEITLPLDGEQFDCLLEELRSQSVSKKTLNASGTQEEYDPRWFVTW